MDAATATVVTNCKRELAQHYGKRLHSLVLFGSCARDQQDEGSDVDLLVVLHDPIDYFGELEMISRVLYPVQLESERLLSVKPVPLSDYESGTWHLYRIARREGVAV